MIRKNRKFQKKIADRDATLFLIFCEGIKRETHYFRYFQEISSKVRLEVVPPLQDEDNSPLGLYQSAQSKIVSADNPNAEYALREEDQVWFVIDTDDWGDKIAELKQKCGTRHWKVAQSNPSFEVWLYYHHFPQIPNFQEIHSAKGWKQFLHSQIPGGFDSRKDSLHIKTAIDNAKQNFSEEDGKICVAATEVYRLAEELYPLIQTIIERALQQE